MARPAAVNKNPSNKINNNNNTKNDKKGIAKKYNTQELVLTSIKKLMKNTGWTSRTIVKFIRAEYDIGDTTLGGKVSRALKRGVRLGLLQFEQGRYRLNQLSTYNLRDDVSTRGRQVINRPLRIRDSRSRL